MFPIRDNVAVVAVALEDGRVEMISLPAPEGGSSASAVASAVFACNDSGVSAARLAWVMLLCRFCDTLTHPHTHAYTHSLTNTHAHSEVS